MSEGQDAMMNERKEVSDSDSEQLRCIDRRQIADYTTSGWLKRLRRDRKRVVDSQHRNQVQTQNHNVKSHEPNIVAFYRRQSQQSSNAPIIVSQHGTSAQCVFRYVFHCYSPLNHVTPCRTMNLAPLSLKRSHNRALYGCANADSVEHRAAVKHKLA